MLDDFIIKKERFVEKISILITAAFGLVAALAWNEAIQELFKQLFTPENERMAKFIYHS